MGEDIKKLIINKLKHLKHLVKSPAFWAILACAFLIPLGMADAVMVEPVENINQEISSTEMATNIQLVMANFVLLIIGLISLIVLLPLGIVLLVIRKKYDEKKKKLFFHLGLWFILALPIVLIAYVIVTTIMALTLS